MQARMTPVGPGERVEVMDVLRGFALLGILLMNIEAFVGPVTEALGGVNPRFMGVDRWVDAAIYIVVQGKFVTLFSLLFGMGFAVMLERADAAGGNGIALYARRLLVLLGIGLAHALLIWSGDILVSYALFGFILLFLFRRVPVSRLPKWGVSLYLMPVLATWAWACAVAAAQQDPQAAAEMHKGLAEQGAQWAAMGEAERQAFGGGSYVDAVVQRAVDTGAQLSFMIIGGWMFLAMFLFGSWFVRSGVIRNPSLHLPLFRRLRTAGLGVGLPLMLWSAWRHPTMSMSQMDFGIALAQSAALLANVLMCMAYMSLVVLAMQHPAWARYLRWLAPAGRMALSNYLLQSAVCTAIFYGYGFGFFEHLARAWQPVFVIALFTLQVAFSHWWLSRFRHGPMEWIWRWGTYLHRPPMRLAVGT